MFSPVTRKRKWILKSALAAGILLFLLVAAAVVFPWEFLCIDSGPVSADAIIVLGGASGDRPEYAATLFKEHLAPKIIVSGEGDDEMYRLIMIRDGVPRSAIRLEGNSRTTKENALYSLQLLKEENARSAIIVTSWYHSRRALKCFEHYAPDMTFFSRPVSYASTWTEGSRGKVIKRIYLEYVKLGYYWARDGVCPF